jgi:hypothetical protein
MEDKKLSTEMLTQDTDLGKQKDLSQGPGNDALKEKTPLAPKDAIPPVQDPAPVAERPAYQTRVIDEKAALDGNISKLAEFINGNEQFTKLELRDQKLLRKQLDAMGVYSDILGTRIQLFS